MKYLLAFSLLCSVAYGQNPTVSIEGADKLQTSNLLLVALGKIDKEFTHVNWGVNPKVTYSSTTLDDGSKVLIFMNPKPGKYRIGLVAQIETDGLDPVSVDFKDVEITAGPPGPEPEPDPTPDPDDDDVVPPPPPPTPGDYLAAWNAITGIDAASKKMLASRLAARYEELGSEIGAGGLTAAEFDSRIADVHRTSLGIAAAAFAPFTKKVITDAKANQFRSASEIMLKASADLKRAQ